MHRHGQGQVSHHASHLMKRKPERAHLAPAAPLQKKLAVPEGLKSRIMVELPVSNKKRTVRSASLGRPMAIRRKLFSISDDALLLQTVSGNPGMKISKIAKTLSEKMGRSKDSVRDRLRKILNKLSLQDKNKIILASKVFYF